jgi:hypothetical protein
MGKFDKLSRGEKKVKRKPEVWHWSFYFHFWLFLVRSGHNWGKAKSWDKNCTKSH